MKSVVMIAYHFPPLAGSSGIQRTLRFSRYLPDLAWEPLILTAHPRAYERTSNDLLADIPANLKITRAQAWDTARHLAIRGRYPAAWARPDRWTSWKFDAIRQGAHLIRRHAPAAIWSTYPIATAHVIGARLHQKTGLPWIADFRDPMAQEGYPADPITRQQFVGVEENAARHAAALVFTTPGACAEYARRYPNAAERMHVIENGYDEEPFQAIQTNSSPLTPEKLTLVHSGIVYPSERDPRHFLDALQQLNHENPELADKLCIRFRASAHDDFLNGEIRQRRLTSLTEVLPPVSYQAALEEMTRADGLIVMQASNCNEQIPAKLYEYFRARRPIFALTDPKGDTAATIKQAGVNHIAPLDNTAEILALLLRFLDQTDRSEFLPRPDYVNACSRKERTRELAVLLEKVTA